MSDERRMELFSLSFRNVVEHCVLAESVWKESIKQRDQLKAENERLREGLSKIYQLPNDSNIQYAVELVIIMQDIAQQTLNEVMK